MMISENIHSQYKENSVPGALECFPVRMQPRGSQGHEQRVMVLMESYGNGY